jgi:hypothetical protein
MRKAGAILVLAALVATSAAWAQAQVSRKPCSLLDGKPCHPAFCGLFHRGPCFPEYLPPIGQDLRLTIEIDDDNDPTAKPDAVVNATPDRDFALDSIGDMYATLRACWLPPPRDAARHGMQYSVRFSFKRNGEIIAAPRRTYVTPDAPQAVRDTYGEAIKAALERCTPLHFSEGMGGAVAGRPIAIRFVDNRTIEKPNDNRGQQ